MADFTNVSNFNKDAGFNKVKFGADAPLLEVELNELQDIQEHKRKELARELLRDGIKDKNAVSYSNGIVTIKDTQFVVDGEIIVVEGSITKSVEDGQKLYLKVWDKEIKAGDSVKKGGNQHTASTVTNTIKDNRIGVETSRRFQTAFELVVVNTDQNAKYLLIGERIGERFEVEVRNYDEHKAENMPHQFINHKENKTYKFGFQVSVDGKPQIIYEEVV